MAVDRLGKTVATGTKYVVAGTCRRVDGDSVLLVCGDGTVSNESIRVLAGDVIQVDDASPPAASQAWPVGSVFIAVVATSPATLLGYGTWVSTGAGRVLVGLDEEDTDFDTVEEEGGKKTVAAEGSVAAPTISGSTGAEAAHTHSVLSSVSVNDHGTAPIFAGELDEYQVVDGNNAGHSTNNNTVTSGAGSSHSHGVGSLAASAPAFTGNATTVVQPYLVVYFWKRTA